MKLYQSVFAIIILSYFFTPCMNTLDAATPPSTTDRASGTPRAIETKRVVTDLGVGRHVGVKLSGHTFRGHIHAIDADHFVLLLDKDGRTLKVTYAEVESLGPNLSKGAKIALGIAGAAAAIGLSMAVFGTHAGEGPQPTF